MSIWKHIVSYFRITRVPETVPEEIQVDIPVIKDTGKAVQVLIDRVNYVCSDVEHQNDERKEAYTCLSLHKGCDEAIPCLIQNQFNRDKWERDLAKATLEKACPNWPSSKEALEKVDYLIGKLLMDGPDAARARSLLSEIGSPAEPKLIERLDHKRNDDGDRCTLVRFLARRKCLEQEFLRILRSIISERSSIFLLSEAIEALGHFETLDNELQAQLRTLLDHDSRDVRLAVLRVMASEVNTTFKPDIRISHALIRCLADPDDEIGHMASELLSKSPETFSEPFVSVVLTARGEYTNAMAQEFWSQLEMVLPTVRAANIQEWNNRTWRIVGLAEARQKPIRLLKRVLIVLRNAEGMTVSQVHIRKLREILDGDGEVAPDLDIIKSCIGILGQSTKDSSVIPIILKYLRYSDPAIRQAVVSSLDMIEPEWAIRPYSEAVLLEIIDGLDTSEHKEVSADVLKGLAGRALPAINKKLGETTSWTLQVRLVQILDSMGEAAIGSWWFLVEVHKVSQNDHVRTDVRELILKLKGIMRRRRTESNVPVDLRDLYKVLYDSYDPDSLRSRYPYDVVLSFASEEKPYVEKVAEHLKSLGHSIFFYPERVAELTGKNGYDKFKEVYTNQGLFCLVFASAHYASKEWTMHELRSAQEGEFERKQKHIIVARFDETVLPGISVFTLGIDCRQNTPLEVAHIMDLKIKERKGM